jgi:hypothetical protein
VITVVFLFILAALLAALSGLIGDEVRGWLALAPRGFLRLVAMRLPADQRRAVYDSEWLPELLAILREADGRPITRLVLGIGFAVDMARGVGEVARELEGVRKDQLGAVVFVYDSDAAALVDGRHDEKYIAGFSGAPVLNAGGQVVAIVEGVSDAEVFRRLSPSGGGSLPPRRY